MKIPPVTAALLVLALFSLPVRTQDAQAGQFQQHMEEARERLQLSDEQVQQMAPVMARSLESQQRILSSYGIDLESRSGPAQKLGPRQAMAMRDELTAVRADTVGALEGILTREQLDEFKRMQEERQAEIRARMRENR